jgi:hypothetical protein
MRGLFQGGGVLGCKGPGRIDHHIGIMVKTPKPILMVILGPKNYRFELGDLASVCHDYIYKYLEYFKAI